MRKSFLVPAVVLIVGLVAVGGWIWWSTRPEGNGIRVAPWAGDTETVEVTDRRPPPPDPKPLLVDDRIEDKTTTFDPSLVDRRPEGDWRINLSEAVIKLDAPMVLPDVYPELVALHPSYAAAIAGMKVHHWETVLPSVNMIDGKAKQFDDGLYAALEQASLLGKSPRLANHRTVVKRLLAKVGPASPAAPFLAAGLSLNGEKAEIATAAEAERVRWLEAFEANEGLSKPIGFYTWNKTLSDGFRTLRFFQQPFRGNSAVARAIAKALADDKDLLAAYERAVAFDSGMTNPPAVEPLSALKDATPPSPDRSFSLFPPSTSPEAELFTRLFPMGVSPDVDLMRALILKIRSGEVDLTPRKGGGWYDHQVHALETLLLPEKGDESRKLLLTKSYKQRMLEAFKALVTKRRETHARTLSAVGSASDARPLTHVAPRLRVEPCPSYYLRTARAYAFLANFLDAKLGEDVLKAIRGLREGGERSPDLRTELASMRDMFYGLALLSAEDIGMRLKLHDDEAVDRDRAERLAAEWLAYPQGDPDLAVDTRVSIPIYIDTTRGVTRLWATVGVRMTRLESSFARAPRIKAKEGEPKDWKAVEGYQLGESNYLIAVDEFAEIELRGNRVLTRAELRAACDRHKTKEEIVAELSK